MDTYMNHPLDPERPHPYAIAEVGLEHLVIVVTAKVVVAIVLTASLGHACCCCCSPCPGWRLSVRIHTQAQRPPLTREAGQPAELDSVCGEVFTFLMAVVRIKRKCGGSCHAPLEHVQQAPCLTVRRQNDSQGTSPTGAMSITVSPGLIEVEAEPDARHSQDLPQCSATKYCIVCVVRPWPTLRRCFTMCSSMHQLINVVQYAMFCALVSASLPTTKCAWEPVAWMPISRLWCPANQGLAKPRRPKLFSGTACHQAI